MSGIWTHCAGTGKIQFLLCKSTVLKSSAWIRRDTCCDTPIDCLYNYHRLGWTPGQ